MADTVHQSASLGIAARAKAIENPNPDPLFDTAQAAVYLHSSEPSLERFRRIGVGPKFVKMGGAVRYRRSDLDSYIEQCTRRPRRRMGKPEAA